MTRNKVSLDPIGVPFNQVFGSDTPPGDVARDIVAQAVDAIRGQVKKAEWTATLGGQNGKNVAIDAGRNCDVELGDVFEAVDQGRRIAVIRIVSVDETSATGEILSGASTKLSGKSVRYLGIDSSTPSAYGSSSAPKHLTMRNASGAFAGPGNSFQKVKDLKRGQRMTLLYTIGVWAKATDGGATFWVPLTAAQIGG